MREDLIGTSAGILGTLRRMVPSVQSIDAPHLRGPQGSVRIQTGTNRC